MRSDARKRADEAVEAYYLSLRRGAGVVPSPGGDATTPAVVAVLRQHSPGAFGPESAACRCDRQWRTHSEHAEHVAATLAAAGVVSDAAAEVAAWDEGVDAAFRGAIMRMNAEDVKRSNPYRAAVSGVAASKADTDEAGA